jgi:uncharacterized protein YwgA
MDIEKIGYLTAFYCIGDNNFSITKSNKMMFFTDLVFYLIKRSAFTSLNYIKMPYGPVPDKYTDILKKLEDEGYISTVRYVGYSANLMTFLNTKKEEREIRDYFKEENYKIIESIKSAFGSESARYLSDFSHFLEPYKQATMWESIDISLIKEDKFFNEIVEVTQN